MKAAQALAQWLGGVKTGQSALADAERKLAAHIANPPKSSDAAEHRAWLATRRELEDGVEAEKAALAIAETKAAEAKAAADEEAIDTKAKEAERAAREAAKLAVEIDPDARRLAEKVSRLCELNESVEAYNRKRGARPYIVDGEARVREVPEKHYPTVYETLTVWVDPKTGRRPSQYREVGGEMKTSDHHGDYVKTTERVVSRNAWSTPAHIPGGRFKDSIRIIGLKGEPLFPAR